MDSTSDQLHLSEMEIKVERVSSLSKSQKSKNPDNVGAFTDLGRLIIYKPSSGTNANATDKSYLVT